MKQPTNRPLDVVNDPSWIAHRYDATGDKVHFVHASRQTQRRVPFLTDEFLTGTDRPMVANRRATIAALGAPARLNFIFHSAYCCSTLLANAFDIPGAAFGLKEPVILNDISGWRRRGAQPADVADRLSSALRLLSRPFGEGEQVIVKPSNVVNAIAPAMLATVPDARAVLLYTPLENYLGSIARKGMWGRLWVRDLFVKLTKDGLTDYGFSPEEILQQTDLQIAAIGWLAQHRLFAQMVDRFGPDRVTALQAEVLTSNPAETLGNVSRHFGLNLGADTLIDIANGQMFHTDAKTGSDYSPSDRQSTHKAGLALHGDEIEKVVQWSNAVAQAAGQRLDIH